MLFLREFKNPKGYLYVKILGNILYSLPIHLNLSSSEEKVRKYSRRKIVTIKSINFKRGYYLCCTLYNASR